MYYISILLKGCQANVKKEHVCDDATISTTTIRLRSNATSLKHRRAVGLGAALQHTLLNKIFFFFLSHFTKFFFLSHHCPASLGL